MNPSIRQATMFDSERGRNAVNARWNRYRERRAELEREAKRRAILEHARANGLALAGWHEDAGRSGATMTRRPGLAAALAEIDAGRAGGLVVAKIDRFGRSSADVLGLVERAQRQGWRLVALDVGLDSTTLAGELVAAALAMAARFEWRRISERQLEKHDELKRQGRRRGRVPVGRILRIGSRGCAPTVSRSRRSRSA